LSRAAHLAIPLNGGKNNHISGRDITKYVKNAVQQRANMRLKDTAMHVTNGSTRKPKLSEKQLQEGLILHLKGVQGLFILQFGKPGGHGALRGAVPVGLPDLLVIVPPARMNWGWPRADPRTQFPAVHIYFEVKTSRGRPTKGQPEMQAELREQGVRVEVIQSDDITEACRQVERVLAEEGVLLRVWE